MALKIIGAGLGRTGTHSLKLALQELGFNKCYHMEDLVMTAPGQIRYWEDAKAGRNVNWEELFDGYQAAVDIPTFIFYKELMKVYPDARVILTVRSAESWYKSFGDTIIRQSKPSLKQIVTMSLKMPFSKKTRQRLRVFQFTGAFLKEFLPAGFENKEETLEKFRLWNEAVQQTVPAGRLLVYEAKDGWEPLCRFLQVPVPDKPFPHSNTTEEFIRRLH